MFMGGVAMVDKQRAAPLDFEETFVRIGRLACEEHYGVGRLKITAWLEECGLERLVKLRGEQNKFSRHSTFREQGKAAFLRELRRGLAARQAAEAAGVSRDVYTWRKADRDFAEAWDAAKVEARSSVARVLASAFPLDPNRLHAANAAQFLRIRKNGGWFVSPMGNGMWAVGTKRLTVDELIAFAKSKGFEPTP